MKDINNNTANLLDSLFLIFAFILASFQNTKNGLTVVVKPFFTKLAEREGLLHNIYLY